MKKKRFFSVAVFAVCVVLFLAPWEHNSGAAESEPVATNGETITEDFEKGYWLYEDPAQDLRIEINRISVKEEKLLWYEADIQASKTTPLQFVSANAESPGRGFKYAERIARDECLVFAVNDDQFAHRMYNHKTVGIVIRGGKVLSDRTRKNGSTMLPNLDVGAFFPDGTMQVFQSNDHNGAEYLAMGAENVLSFGPYIIKDGEINPVIKRNYRYRESRCAIGMVEPFHYIVIMVEGLASFAQGVQLEWVGERMSELGVQQALNLDGGHTSSIVFMGKKLEISNPLGKVRKSRTLSGMIGLGVSEHVPAFEGIDK